ncbi:hypothetical protein J2S40_004065 [Nocardioides luteus]|uniref:AbiEi antitoxin C-terminal domain-containing protein n=1 Tax=Nocardioides luteus TaxID=1844 RepID=A0ABQ5SPK1_9ACTN|nr:type IV toxin-antitoxin system AbiEi family antitoxin domain-containing protein [Nocardioides luteus]MDR7313007.1 hypothetical protein [Nocardioides luteus]GGR44723.1 hypothetical protein GCM10010197_07940 [Nocardioides luteus]GLJ66067.1 hypothetical protein GCM10017579_01030 [Nocardioides luteus]
MSDATDEQAAFDREHAALLLDAQRRMQDGVTSHAQLVASGLSRIDIERGVRRNELRRVHPRVYVNHTGPLTWEQRAWAAVLYADPAVLCWGSLEAPKGRDDGRPIHVAIDHSRKVMPQPGIVVHRMRGLSLKAYGGTPPRLEVEDNALAMANEAKTEIDAIARVAEVASRSYVTAATLQSALDRARLDDLAQLGAVTARLRFHQVFGTPRQTAARLGRILTRNGWTGTIRDCGESCTANQ